jgi:hypothetical protein
MDGTTLGGITQTSDQAGWQSGGRSGRPGPLSRGGAVTNPGAIPGLGRNRIGHHEVFLASRLLRRLAEHQRVQQSRKGNCARVRTRERRLQSRRHAGAKSAERVQVNAAQVRPSVSLGSALVR